MSEDSKQYKARKAFFSQLLTIYGRKPVLEALQQAELSPYKLHLADSNRRDGIINEIIALAEKAGIELAWHDRKALSRISKNGKQDQGVALDISLPGYQDIAALPEHYQLLALDGISNPQNLGMIIRSVAASPLTGLLLPRKGCAALSPLVIKASAGTLFKAPIFYCDSLDQALDRLGQQGANIALLSSHASDSLYDYQASERQVYVLGNETEGVSRETQQRANSALKIPMHNGVESLNVAVTAALIAFKP